MRHYWARSLLKAVTEGERHRQAPCRSCVVTAKERGTAAHKENHFTAKTQGENNLRGFSCLSHSCGFVWAPFTEAKQFTTALPLSLQSKRCKAACLSQSSDFPLAKASLTPVGGWQGENSVPSPGLFGRGQEHKKMGHSVKWRKNQADYKS